MRGAAHRARVKRALQMDQGTTREPRRVLTIRAKRPRNRKAILARVAAEFGISPGKADKCWMATRSKAVNVWTWRRMIRDHGTLQATTLLTMYTIATYMDRDGFTYVGQARIAEGARTSVRTVKRHVEAARRLGWLHVELTRVTSRTNRHMSFLNNYRACVPGALELSDKDEELRDVVLSASGDIDEGGDTAMAPRYPLDLTEGGDTGSRTWGHSEQEVGTNGAKVGTQLWPKNSSVTNSSVITPQREGALARTAAVDKSTRKEKSKELTHISSNLPAHSEATEEFCK